MKIKNIIAILLLSVLCVSLSSCGQNKVPADLWESATYTEDTELGQGEKSITAEVEAMGKTVTLTVKTDKKILGEALSEHNLISGEQGQYGLYVNVVNGIEADFDANNSYWSINKNGNYMVTGVDSTEIADGDSYQFVYTITE